MTAVWYMKNVVRSLDAMWYSAIRDPKPPEPLTLSFLSLLFWKMARKTPKKQGFFIPTEPLKSLEKKGKTLKKTRNSSQGKKQGILKKQGKEGQGTWWTFRIFFIFFCSGARERGEASEEVAGAAVFYKK